MEEIAWRKIAALALNRRVGRNQVAVGSGAGFALIKLRPRGADVTIYRWTLRFEDGAIVDLSVNCLEEGKESRALTIAGRRLRSVAVDYEIRNPSWGRRLEIWAQS